MNLFRRIQHYFAFTANEQKIFLFLALIFLVGSGIRLYKNFNSASAPQFDYTKTDQQFIEHSRMLPRDSLERITTDSQPKKKINLNSATKQELVSLPGIGEGIAERILLYREEHKKFSTINDLRKVKGIGEKKFERLREYIEAQ